MSGLVMRHRSLEKPPAVASFESILLGTSGLVGYWPMDDDGSGAGPIRDASGGGHPGNYNNLGALGFRQPGPQAGTYSVRFPAASSQEASGVPKTGLPDSASSAFAYEIWAKIAANGSPSGYGPMVNRGGGGSGNQIYLLTDPSDVLWRWDAFNTGFVMPDGGGWHQIVYGWTPGAPGLETIWVDGGGSGKKFTNAASFSGALPGTAWFFSGTSTGTHIFNGWLCRFSLHNRIPTDAEVAARYAAGIL